MSTTRSRNTASTCASGAGSSATSSAAGTTSEAATAPETRAITAIVLAAGVGRRLGAQSGPKCLLEVGGRSLLERMLDALARLGVAETVVVVGHGADRVRAALGERPGVRLLFNPDYRKGAILSLWTAREALDGPVLVMDADVLFPDALLRRLLDSPHPNAFLMDRRAPDDGEAQMLMAREGRVLDIARGVRGAFDACGESVGFLKLDAAAARTLRELLEQAVAAGRDTIEHEEVYPELMRRCVIGYETVDDLPWLEIDFPEDLAAARRLVESGAI